MKTMTKVTSVLCAVAAVAGALVSKTEAAQAQAQATPQPVRTGEAIYNDKCVYCHSDRGWATRVLAARTLPGEAMLTKRSELPADYTSVVVRRGIGSMPAFTPTELSDAEIAVVSQWLARRK